MIGSEIRQFKITSKLGEGGMGEVFVATDSRLDRKVALKFLPPHYSKDPEFKARFEHEAKAAAALNHPNIITVYELGEHQGRNFIVMELIEGETLEARIKSGSLSLSQAVDIAQQICAGLASAHEAGIIHRDIKPANIFIGKNGHVKILDFGLAKSRRATTETKVGTTVGTIQYEAPEQTRGENVDQRADLFSLGVVLYEMVTSHRPFRGEFEDAIRYAIANDSPEPMARYKADVSDDLQRIVSKLLEKDPDLRYQTAGGVTSDLKLLRRTSGPHASSIHQAASSTVTAAQIAKPKSRLMSFLVPSGIAIVAVVLALVFKPWNISVQPTQLAEAAEDRLAVMYFDNLPDPTDESRLGEMVTNLLITSLSESKSIKVLSSQRLYDILQSLGQTGTRSLDRAMATKVAQEANAKWMLTGTILQKEPQVVITAQVIDVATGQVELSTRSESKPGEQIFAQMDRLTSELRLDLDLPAPTDSPVSRSLADATTTSEEAYRLYLEGIEDLRRLFNSRAKEKFMHAVSLDSTFAMAWFWLAHGWWDEPEAAAWARKAMKYSHKVRESEHALIVAISDYIARDIDGSITGFKRAAELDPENGWAWGSIAYVFRENKIQLDSAIHYALKGLEINPKADFLINQLAYYYKDLREYDDALDAIDRYIELVPGEPNPYDSRAEILLAAGRFDEAIASYQKAMAVDAEFASPKAALAKVYLFHSNRSSADSLAQMLMNSPRIEERSRGRYYAALVEASTGKIASAIELIEQGLGADRLEAYEKAYYNSKYWLLSECYYALGQHSKAIAVIEELMTQDRVRASTAPLTWEAFLADLHARTGDAASAAPLLQAVEQAVMTRGSGREIAELYQAQGRVQYALGNLDSSVVLLKQSARLDMRTLRPYTEQLLAEVYLSQEKPKLAIPILERSVSTLESVFDWQPINGMEAHVLLGRAYAEVDKTQKAAEQFQIVIDYFKDGDDELVSLKEARRRLAELQS